MRSTASNVVSTSVKDATRTQSCDVCHAPHPRHKCPHSVNNPVQMKKREEEYKKLQEEDKWERGEGLTEETITELKGGRYKNMTPPEISELMRVRWQKGKGTDERERTARPPTEERLISFERC